MWPFSRKSVSPTEIKTFLLTGGGELLPEITFAGLGLESLLQRSSAVFACVTANADGVGGFPAVVQRRGSGSDEGRWIEERGTNLDEVLDEPGIGHARAWDFGLLVAHMTLCLELTGHFVGVIHSREGRLTGIQPVSTLGPSVIRDGSGEILKWSVLGKELPASRILHLRKASPSVDSLGLSPWAVAKLDAEIDEAARRRQVYSLRNIASPGMVVLLEGGLSDVQQKAAVAAFREQYAGASKEGLPMVVGGNAKLSAPPTTFTSRAYMDLRAASIEDIGRIYRTPDVVMGRGKDASRFVDSLRTWLNAALYPLLRTIYNGINRQVIRPLYGRDTRLWYDIRDSQFALAVRGEQAELANSILDLGYSANQASAYAGLDLPWHPDLDLTNTRFAIAGRADAETETPQKSLPAFGARTAARILQSDF